MLMDIGWKWQIAHTNCVFCNLQEVGVELELTI